jgi:hypothetical protein
MLSSGPCRKSAWSTWRQIPLRGSVTHDSITTFVAVSLEVTILLHVLLPLNRAEVNSQIPPSSTGRNNKTSDWDAGAVGTTVSRTIVPRFPGTTRDSKDVVVGTSGKWVSSNESMESILGTICSFWVRRSTELYYCVEGGWSRHNDRACEGRSGTSKLVSDWE